MTTVISVENLSKTYRLGQIGTGTFTHDLAVWWAKVRGRPNPLLKIGETDHGNRNGEELWALKDVSFEVKQGEVLGIIGRNGAGKSTLLKILSRVTAPTSGKIKVKGRIASLLEVGTGFHPELTGRENIYLNGAILGMTRQEVTRKFDEIVDFAEVEKFIDTPVKRYSSGMYVRLAFAVAAHLDPEILVVDEVLAVGDVEFQKKCLGKMGEVAGEGRTVLFVSHNMASIEALCSKCIELSSGKINGYGQTSEIIGKFLTVNNSVVNQISIRQDRMGASKIHVSDIWLSFSRAKARTETIILGDDVTVNLEVDSDQYIEQGYLNLILFDQANRLVFSFNAESGFRPNFKVGKNTFQLHLPFLSLLPGNYSFTTQILYPDAKMADRVERALTFVVTPNDLFRSGKSFQKGHGIYLLPHQWRWNDGDKAKQTYQPVSISINK